MSILAIFAVTAIFTGCQNNSNKAYDQAMAAGKDAVASKNYSKAESEFDHAYDLKKTDEAKAYGQQAKDVKDAIAAGEKAHYDDALTKTTAAVDKANGYSVLKHQAQDLNKTFTKCKDNYENDIQPLQEEAQSDEANNKYQDAINSYKKILALPYINGKYYKAIKKATEKSIAFDKRQMKKDDKQSDSEDTISSATNSSKNTKSNNTKNDAKTSSSANNAGLKTGEAANNNREVDGQTVSMSGVGQIRGRLKELGYNSASWSDADIINMFRSAAANGHKTPDSITKQDVQNYLKH